MTVTDEMLMAYVDGELSTEDAALVDAAVAVDPVLAERLADHQSLAGGLRGAFADIADEPVPERLTALLRSAKVVGLDSARARRQTPLWGQWGAMAAGIAAGLVVGLTLPQGPAPLVGSDMKAHGQLASALNTQLASAPAKGALVKVGFSFRSNSNTFCRTFTVTKGEGPAGVACREGDAWTVRMAVAHTATAAGGDYRTAASDTPPDVLAAAQALMQGDPLDADGEAAAKAKGWK